MMGEGGWAHSPGDPCRPRPASGEVQHEIGDPPCLWETHMRHMGLRKCWPKSSEGLGWGTGRPRAFGGLVRPADPASSGLRLPEGWGHLTAQQQLSARVLAPMSCLSQAWGQGPSPDTGQCVLGLRSPPTPPTCLPRLLLPGASVGLTPHSSTRTLMATTSPSQDRAFNVQANRQHPACCYPARAGGTASATREPGSSWGQPMPEISCETWYRSEGAGPASPTTPCPSMATPLTQPP